MEKIVVAMDLGGTNMRFATVRPDGRIVASHRRRTPKTDTATVVSSIVAGFAKVIELSNTRTPLALAAAVPTTSSTPSGVLSKLPNLPALDNFALGDLLRSEFRAPVLVVNDATSATIGENWLGASKGAKNVIGLTLGTGVGGGLIIDGRPHTGANGSAGELGHICIEPTGPPCGCGSNGCLEQYVSGTAFVRMANDARLKVATSKDVFSLACKGNKRAVEVLGLAGRALGIALSSLVNVLNPDRIVIGGGVSKAWQFLRPQVLSEVEARAFEIPASHVTIVRAKLGDRAGVLGAARIAYLNSAGMES